ncbi:MAG TPA: hypothetical protein VMU25_01970 [Candidatus Paceibacterota bacterium]|nr:hypothetical protein [Candidatus Paceibacterota bacterium]
MKRTHIQADKKRTKAPLAAVVLAIIAAATLAESDAHGRVAAKSPEVDFADTSKNSGLEIVPASCASSPSYYHASLQASGDGRGYVLGPGQIEYGAYDSYTGQYVCASNTSGYNVFIPGNTASEINYFSAYPPPGVTAWHYP